MDIQLDMVFQGSLLKLRCDTNILGSQHDNNAQALVFTRPAGYEGHDLILFLSSAYRSFEPVFMGGGNRFPVPAFYTRTRLLCVQAALRNSGGTVVHSDTLCFSLRDSLGLESESAAAGSDYAFMEKAFTGVEISDGQFYFNNYAGKKIGSVALPPYGQAAERAYVDERSASALAEAMRYAEEQVASAGLPPRKSQSVLFIGDSLTSQSVTSYEIKSIASDDSGNVTITMTGTLYMEVKIGGEVIILGVSPGEFCGRYRIQTQVGGVFTVRNTKVAPNITGDTMDGFGTKRLAVCLSPLPGFPHLAAVISRQKIPLSYIVAQSGTRTDAWLHNLEHLVYPFDTGYVHILLGTNDISQGRTLESIIADYAGLVDKLLKKGYEPILDTIPPRNIADHLLKVEQFNLWIKSFARTKNLVCVDYYGALLDPAT